MKRVVVVAILAMVASLGTVNAGNFGFGLFGGFSEQKYSDSTITYSTNTAILGIRGIMKFNDALQVEPGAYMKTTREFDPESAVPSISDDRSQTFFGGDVGVYGIFLKNGPWSALFGGDFGFDYAIAPKDTLVDHGYEITLYAQVPLAVELAVTDIISVRVSQVLAFARVGHTQILWDDDGNGYSSDDNAIGLTQGWNPYFSINFTF